MNSFEMTAHQLDDSDLAAVNGGLPANYDWITTGATPSSKPCRKSLGVVRYGRPPTE
ncbi:hypothetical protein GCM10009556_080690 [Acrocarpospora pleiomorpha]|uniref:hypothetical protein n=1 Tax=Acrocarpospora pleiomorpha TaxID=90975 RepID=UPI0012D301BC|nr:hypothetical protein [Acrocarpospora pleiomorpha]